MAPRHVLARRLLSVRGMAPRDLSIDADDPADGPATREQRVLMAVLDALLREDAERRRGGAISARTREVRRAQEVGTRAPELRARHVEGERGAIKTADESSRRLLRTALHPKQVR